MGLSLGRLAQTVANDLSRSYDGVKNGAQQLSETPKMQPLNDVFVTFNERTSNHLGISLTDDMRGQIDLVLPAR